ncbi:agmatine deiminase family protein [Gimesia maris]|uniref:Agmatine deiminase n=1 Tax=Gimesia maris TaxID=122 RepID=A0ABX5YUM7_9PLAN|nr:agmatine deiminase family protein [Gimesia maris]EDL57427.1 Porphyromonas-type peptidyl-arginine deiminase [Gimesia maris DSM 8797]QEG19267.1 Agmatine deiminase [Gimesia maris]QGQ27858.1 agmatine deiminase family protein [Gimesia maris]
MSEVTRRLPAEWEPQQTTLLCFPHNGNDWPGKYEVIKWAFVEIIRKVAEFERVLLVVKDGELQQKVDGMLQQAHANTKQVKYILQNTNRNWMRDSGPIVVQRSDGKREALQFRFNGWAKYPNHRLDWQVPSAVAKSLKVPVTEVCYQGRPVVLEGGAIEVNGRGTLITTEECLLDQKTQVRNPGFTKEDYAAIFNEYLGVTNVIWLGDGIEGDDTHGHVDDICRFVNPTTVVACMEANKKDVNHHRLAQNLERLKSARLEEGSKLNVVEMPMPARLDFEDLRLPASYVNFLVTNGCVLVPTFNDPNDAIALGILSALFTERRVIGIHAVDLVWGLGTLHCLSHEITAGE